MTDERDWASLASIVKTRREAMALSRKQVAARGGPSDYTVARIERGETGPYRPKTFVQLEKGLSWGPGAPDRVLAGEATDADRDPNVRYGTGTAGLQVGAAAAPLGGLSAAVGQGGSTTERTSVTEHATATDSVSVVDHPGPGILAAVSTALSELWRVQHPTPVVDRARRALVAVLVEAEHRATQDMAGDELDGRERDGGD